MNELTRDETYFILTAIRHLDCKNCPNYSYCNQLDNLECFSIKHKLLTSLRDDKRKTINTVKGGYSQMKKPINEY